MRDAHTSANIAESLEYGMRNAAACDTAGSIANQEAGMAAIRYEFADEYEARTAYARDIALVAVNGDWSQTL